MDKLISNIEIPMLGKIVALDMTIGLEYLHSFYHNLNLLNVGVDFKEVFQDQKIKSKSISVYTNSIEFNQFETITPTTNIPKNSIAILNYSGAMRMEDTLCSVGVRHLTKNINKLSESENVSTIVLQLNTGGGEVDASALLGSCIAECKKEFIVHTNKLASGGVLAAVNADKIYANDTYSKIGSIGAYISVDAEAVKYIKENIISVYSDLSPDKNKELRELIEKNTTDEMKLQVNKLATMFQKDVMQKRTLLGDVDTTLKGGMFYAEEAKDRGLIDGIVGFKTLIDKLSENLIFK